MTGVLLFALGIYVSVLMQRGNLCPECGESCTALEADALFGCPCYTCQDEAALLAEIRGVRPALPPLTMEDVPL